nr:MAG TPA: hypothetical protein [Caudoviricetes sp.]
MTKLKRFAIITTLQFETALKSHLSDLDNHLIGAFLFCSRILIK